MHHFIWQVMLQGLVKRLVQWCSTTHIQHLLLSNMSNEELLGTQQLPQIISLLEAHTPEEVRPARVRQVMLKGWMWTKLGSQSHMQRTNYQLPLMVVVATGRISAVRQQTISNHFLTCYQYRLLMLSATLFWQIQKCSSVQIYILCQETWIPRDCRTVLEVADFYSLLLFNH